MEAVQHVLQERRHQIIVEQIVPFWGDMWEMMTQIEGT